MLIYDAKGPEHIRGRIYLTLLFLFVVYNIVNIFVQNSDMILASRVVQASACNVVLYVYWRDFKHAISTPEPIRTDHLISGIWIGWLANLCQALFSIVFRLAGNPWWLANAEINAPYIIMSVIAAVLHVSAPGSLDGIVPRKNRIAMGAGFGLATLCVIGLFMTRPDIGPLVERARPYIGDFWRQSKLPAAAAQQQAS